MKKRLFICMVLAVTLAGCGDRGHKAGSTSAPASTGLVPPTAIDFINTVTGEKLDLNDSMPEGRDTPAVKEFLQTGHDPYIEIAPCFPNAKSLFLTACSGCHGGEMEGKVGPSLGDDYWTYPANTTDVGMFATIFGGASGMMGPHNHDISLDQILRVVAWIRHHYTGPAEHADWLTDAQKAKFKPFTPADEKAIKDFGRCIRLPIAGMTGKFINQKEDKMAKMIALCIAIAMSALGITTLTSTAALAAYDGTHCKTAGNCWEPQPGYPDKLLGSKYDPHLDPLEVAKQQKAENDMAARNKIRVDNFKKTGKWVDDVSRIQSK